MDALPFRSELQIVSGGQTGVDLAALDVAIELGMPHGGWCPRGRRFERGRIPDQYCLRETESANYRVRTEQNVVDSDGTLVLYRGSLTGGTAFTVRMAMKHARPCLQLDLDADPDPARLQVWIDEQALLRLNVAGPRESTSPGIHDQAHRFLQAAFRG